MITRRTLLAAAFAVGPTVLGADIGHPGDGMRVDTLRAEAQDDKVAMIFLLRNTGEELAGVELVYSDMGDLVAELPVTLEPGHVQMLQVQMTPTVELPGMFTVMFDFGDGTLAPVMVVLPGG